MSLTAAQDEIRALVAKEVQAVELRIARRKRAAKVALETVNDGEQPRTLLAVLERLWRKGKTRGKGDPTQVILLPNGRKLAGSFHDAVLHKKALDRAKAMFALMDHTARIQALDLSRSSLPHPRDASASVSECLAPRKTTSKVCDSLILDGEELDSIRERWTRMTRANLESRAFQQIGYIPGLERVHLPFETGHVVLHQGQHFAHISFTQDLGNAPWLDFVMAENVSVSVEECVADGFVLRVRQELDEPVKVLWRALHTAWRRGKLGAGPSAATLVHAGIFVDYPMRPVHLLQENVDAAADQGTLESLLASAGLEEMLPFESPPFPAWQLHHEFHGYVACLVLDPGATMLRDDCWPRAKFLVREFLGNHGARVFGHGGRLVLISGEASFEISDFSEVDRLAEAQRWVASLCSLAASDSLEKSLTQIVCNGRVDFQAVHVLTNDPSFDAEILAGTIEVPVHHVRRTMVAITKASWSAVSASVQDEKSSDAAAQCSGMHRVLRLKEAALRELMTTHFRRDVKRSNIRLPGSDEDLTTSFLPLWSTAARAERWKEDVVAIGRAKEKSLLLLEANRQFMLEQAQQRLERHLSDRRKRFEADLQDFLHGVLVRDVERAARENGVSIMQIRGWNLQLQKWKFGLADFGVRRDRLEAQVMLLAMLDRVQGELMGEEQKTCLLQNHVEEDVHALVARDDKVLGAVPDDEVNPLKQQGLAQSKAAYRSWRQKVTSEMREEFELKAVAPTKTVNITLEPLDRLAQAALRELKLVEAFSKELARARRRVQRTSEASGPTLTLLRRAIEGAFQCIPGA
ncbi:Hypothetical Protein FCC1311_092542 [Hondaea fermentalgiana]|uniref:Uncharacterized protein n=1 Tax=Hondaea fermentalgiana TaxID=2315210 RepID=A0A2R5GQ99_9STRA|nr:Hypothetical Protein FCC1311_092542 [Hondaea fermentalgiana]|eukprot:GBG33030.1 Hypothetical Protein FCC1311_092542 [Hondaea fermentalgiana]